jgi:hypothetical protein
MIYKSLLKEKMALTLYESSVKKMKMSTSKKESTLADPFFRPYQRPYCHEFPIPGRGIGLFLNKSPFCPYQRVLFLSALLWLRLLFL